jgi:hypothetical protein
MADYLVYRDCVSVLVIRVLRIKEYSVRIVAFNICDNLLITSGYEPGIRYWNVLLTSNSIYSIDKSVYCPTVYLITHFYI